MFIKSNINYYIQYKRHGEGVGVCQIDYIRCSDALKIFFSIFFCTKGPIYPMRKFDGIPEPYELPDREFDSSTWNTLVLPHVAEAISKIPPELVNLGETELHALLKDKLQRNPVLDRLRQAFWIEYDAAIYRGRQMRMSVVYSSAGVSRQNWSSFILTDHLAMAWITRPPGDYLVRCQDLLSDSLRQMKRMLNATNIINEKGELNPKVAVVILQIAEMSHLRVHGAPVMRMERKSLNVNVNGPPTASADKSVPELEAELAALKAKNVSKPQLSSPTPDPIMDQLTDIKDVVPIEVSVGVKDD